MSLDARSTVADLNRAESAQSRRFNSPAAIGQISEGRFWVYLLLLPSLISPAHQA